MKTCMACGLLLALASAAHAAVEDCPAPDAGLEGVTGAVTDFRLDSQLCRAPDYTSPLEPLPAQPEVPQVTSPTMPTPTLVVDDQAAQDAGVLEPPPAAEDGTRQNMNDLQMRRLGQLDARMGRPLNMQYASDLGYLQGYTQGQAAKYRAQGGGGW